MRDDDLVQQLSRWATGLDLAITDRMSRGMGGEPKTFDMRDKLTWLRRACDRLRAMRTALQAVEYSAGCDRCPVCGGLKPRAVHESSLGAGHRPDCQLALVLAAGDGIGRPGQVVR